MSEEIENEYFNHRIITRLGDGAPEYLLQVEGLARDSWPCFKTLPQAILAARHRESLLRLAQSGDVTEEELSEAVSAAIRALESALPSRASSATVEAEDEE